MSRPKLTRRQFTETFAGGLVGAALGGSRPARASRVQVGEPRARFAVYDPAGNPVAAEALDRFHASDSLVRPIPIQPAISRGSVEFVPPSVPFRVAVPLEVPGFGEVYVYAGDADGGYTAGRFTRTEPLNFTLEAASGRLALVRDLDTMLERAGIATPTPTRQRITLADDLLRRGRAASAVAEAVRWGVESLRESMWAGEELVLARARAAIARRGARPGFLFGSNAFGFTRHGRAYAERFEPVLDTATLPFYLGSTQSTQGQLDYSDAERILDWLEGTTIIPKGHPLIFFYPSVIPAWLRNRSASDVTRLCVDYVGDTIARFRHRIHVWEVVNELHGKNELGLSKAELVALTAQALDAARAADPTCFRIVNNCCPWCEYLAREVPLGLQSVYDYLTMLGDAGIGYEAIGLQYYYYGRDMLEIERSLETFSTFDRPVHVTELGVPSSSEEIPTDWPHGVRFPWHGRSWSERTQADWLERFYTIAFSKPWIEAISWWDLNDPAFIPHGGLLDQALRPKESYQRLRSLTEGWRRLPAP